MLWILLVMGIIAATVVAVVVGGLATPRAHVAARAVSLRAAPELVWRTVRDVGAYAEWRPELLSSEATTGEDGEEWREASRRHSVRFGVTADEPPRRFAARILDDDLPFSGAWQWRVEPVSGGTRVTVTEQGEIGNPVFRFVATHMTGHTRTIDAYLRALAIRVGDPDARVEDAVPESARA